MAINTGDVGTSREAGKKNKKNKVRLASLLALLVVGSPAAAQDWDFEPFVELVATYTDNLFLAAEGDETSDYIGQVNPGFRLVNDEGVFTADVYYRMQSLFFSEDSELNTIYHQLAGNGTLTVAPELFYVDLDASINQSVVDPTQAIPLSNVIATQNFGDIALANATPYLIHRFGSSGTYARLDYTYGIGRYDDFEDQPFTRVDDFDQSLVGFYLGTDTEETGIEWSARYDLQSVDYEMITDYEYERAGIGVGIPITSSFRLVGFGGLESDVIESREVGGLDSDYWEVGFRINAGEQNTFEIRAGERFFGDTYFGNLEYIGRALTASITYNQNPTTSALDSLGDTAAGNFTVTGAPPVFDDPLPGEDLDVLPVRAEVYVFKSLRAQVSLSGGRSELFAIYADEEREFIDDDEGLNDVTDGQIAGTLGVRYDLGPRTELELSGTLIRYDFANIVGETEVKQIFAGITRQLGQQTEFLVSFRHTEQESDEGANFGDYVENAVDIGLVRRF